MLAHLAALLLALPDSTLPGRVVDVWAGEFYFQSPDTVAAGLTTIRLHNRAGNHALWLLRLDPGHSAGELVKFPDGPPPWAHELGGPGFVEPGGTANATFVLAPGTYAIGCFVAGTDGVPHVRKGMFRALVVRAPRVEEARTAARLPAPERTVSLVDYAYRFSAPLHAGRQLVRVTNAGTTRHEFKLFRVLPGHTARESLDYDPSSGAPPPDVLHAGLATMPAGASILTTLDLPPGTYTLFCVFHERTMGMKTSFVVR